MSRDHYSDPPTDKQQTTAQKRIGEMSAVPIYCKYVKQEEIENLQQFEMLDELNEDNHPECTAGSDAKTQGIPEEETQGIPEEETQGIPEEEIGSKLEGPSDGDKTVLEGPGMEDYTTRTQITFEDKYNNPLEMLPIDWIATRHASGLPVYLHRPTRVCTLAKPYCIATASVRGHNIPMGAIPCYAYRRGLEEEAKQQKMRDQIMHEQICNGMWTTDGNSMATYNGSQETSRTAEGIITEPEVSIKQVVRVDGETGLGANESLEEGNDQASASVGDPSSLQPVPPPRVEPLAPSWMTQQLTPEQVTNYCKTLFHFKTDNVLHFKTWAARRKYFKEKKTLQNPELPQDTKLTTVPAQLAANCQHNNKYRMAHLNLSDPRFLSAFHEYVRHALHTQPMYELAKLENSSTPFQATIYIGGMKYGVGEGHSKREAKSAAARATIHILIPELKHERQEPDAAEPDYSLFDSMDIEDPRATQLCHDAGEPTPYALLRICLLRNLSSGQRINVEITKMPCLETKLIMTVGKHTATVVCKNKKTAKQHASQKILKKLHPQVKSWGSLLRMYGSHSDKSNRERKLEMRELWLLQRRRVRGESGPGVRDESGPGVRDESGPGVRGESEPGVRGESEPGVRGEPEPGVRGESGPGVRGESGPGVRDESGPGVRGEPEPGVWGEPEPGVRGESGPGVRGEPEPGVRGEPEPGVRGESEPGVLGEPEPGVLGEPEPGMLGEPEPGVLGEPEPGVLGEPEPGVLGEPEPGVLGEPEPGVLGEPEPGVLGEPGPGVLDALRRAMRRLQARDKAGLPYSSNFNPLDF